MKLKITAIFLLSTLTAHGAKAQDVFCSNAQGADQIIINDAQASGNPQEIARAENHQISDEQMCQNDQKMNQTGQQLGQALSQIITGQPGP